VRVYNTSAQPVRSSPVHYMPIRTALRVTDRKRAVCAGVEDGGVNIEVMASRSHPQTHVLSAGRVAICNERICRYEKQARHHQQMCTSSISRLAQRALASRTTFASPCTSHADCRDAASVCTFKFRRWMPSVMAECGRRERLRQRKTLVYNLPCSNRPGRSSTGALSSFRPKR